MNGFQATRALSRDAATSAIPVLIVSTKAMEADRAWGLRQGAKDYIVKPPNEGALIGRIRIPEVVGNLTFGGPKRNRLFMAGSQSLYAVHVNTQGAAPG